MLITKRTNGKQYQLIEIGHYRIDELRSGSTILVQYQALNPKTGQPWQAIRSAKPEAFVYHFIEQ